MWWDKDRSLPENFAVWHEENKAEKWYYRKLAVKVCKLLLRQVKYKYINSTLLF